MSKSAATTLPPSAWLASVGDIVPRDRISPALGGLIVASESAAAAFAINVRSFLPMIHALLRMKSAQPTTTLPCENLSGAVGAGLR